MEALVAARLFLVVLLAGSCLSSRAVSWYMPRAGGPATLDWISNASVSFANKQPVATGVYLCCGAFSIDSTGLLNRISDADIARDIKGLADAHLTVHYVFSISMASILGRSWESTGVVHEMALVAYSSGFDGFVCDYEPSEDYSAKHAELYAAFLAALSSAMHRVKKQSGFCSAGWGILDQWSAYRSTGVDIATSMTPTYNWIGNGDVLFRFVTEEIAPGAMPRLSVGAGVGTTMATGYHPEWQYNWTEHSLTVFSTWLKETANVTRMDFWRADIDHDWAPEATASFVFRAAAAFLQ